MTGTSRKMPSCLSEPQVLRLFKCAVKDDDALVEAIIEKLYGMMKDFDAKRGNEIVELIVDRDMTAGSKFRALLDDLWASRPASALAA
jgi:hypothetical protein